MHQIAFVLKSTFIAIPFLLSFTNVSGQVVKKLRALEDADTTLVYKSNDSTNLVLYGFYPEKNISELKPVIIFFHGGGWKKGTPASMAPHCKYFASRGIIGFTASYGLAIENGNRSVEDCVTDAKEAVHFIYNHAEALNINKDNIILSGGSAGGHLALAVAMDLGIKYQSEYQPSVKGLILFNPAAALTQQSNLSDLYNDAMKERARSLFKGNPEDICPLSNIQAGMAPMLLMHGSKDWLLPAAQLFKKTSEASGNRCEIRVWEGLDHGFYHVGKNKSRNFIETCEEADRFLESLNLVSGKPQVAAFVSEFDQ